MTPAEPEPAAPVEPVAPVAPVAEEPRRPTLPTFEELLAAAAAPAPAEAAVVHEQAAPVAEAWEPKSYGAPAPAAHEPEVAPAPSLPPVPAALSLPPVEPIAPVAPAPAPVEPAFQTPAEPALPAVPVVPAFLPAPAQPAFQAPSAPVMPSVPSLPPVPAAFPADPGLVMPSAPILETAPRAEQSGARHAEAVPEIPAPASAAPPAPPPVGYTSSADPNVANRYRQALHNPEPTPDTADPMGSPLTGTLPTLGAPAAGSPNQPGWQGMPLPTGSPLGPGAATAYNPAVPGGYTPPPMATGTGTNKVAWSALSSGAIALGLTLVGVFVTDRIGGWPAILAVAAIVQGIIGAVRFRRARTGLPASIFGMLLGLATLAVMVGAVVMAVLASATYAWDADAAEQAIMSDVNADLVGVVSAECPVAPDTSPGASFECTWYDANEVGHPAIFEVSDDGSQISWYFSD